jgi:hypothetical protein
VSAGHLRKALTRVVFFPPSPTQLSQNGLQL